MGVYVGALSRELVILQCGKALCIANMARFAREYAYQQCIALFGGMGRIELEKPLPLLDLLRLGILDPGSGYDPVQHAHVDINKMAENFLQLLDEKADMLNEYISLDVRGRALHALPNALVVGS